MKKVSLGLAAFAPLALAATLVVPSAAATPNSTPLNAPDEVQAISAVAPEVFEQMASEPEDAKANFPTNTAGKIEVESAQGATIGLGLPFGSTQAPKQQISSTIAAYDNANGTTTVPVAKEDGGVAVQTVIEDASAPEAYEYELDLPAGASLETTENGGAIILDSDGQYLAAFATPWAKDAGGAEVPTRYEVDGDRLIQHVDLDAALDFPVVADPYLGVALINGGKSNFTGSGTSRTANIHVYPQMAVAWAAGAAYGNGWSEAKAKMGSELNKETYRQQFKCHADNAPLVMAGGAYASTWDNIWNLEFRRGTHHDYGNVASHKCNW